jgi:hypothetical protein
MFWTRHLASVCLGIPLTVLLLPTRDTGGWCSVPKDRSKTILGTWSDACSCSIPCTCWRTGRSNVQHCLNVQVFQLDSLESVENSTFVLVGNSDGYWPPSQYVLYFDDGADPLLVRTLSSFFQTFYGAGPTRLSAVKLKQRVSPRRRHLEIPGILHYDIEAGSRTTVSDMIRGYLYEFLTEPEQWRTRELSYQPKLGHSSESKGTNALVARFRINPEYLEVSFTLSENSIFAADSSHLGCFRTDGTCRDHREGITQPWQ